jgi:hypothetical protein
VCAPQEVCDLVAVLEEVAGPDQAARLLREVARTESDSLALVAAGLRDRDRTGQAGTLLDLAAAASTRPPRMIALVAALWSAGLAAEIDRLLDAAAARPVQPQPVCPAARMPVRESARSSRNPATPSHFCY